jgi:hypothetical protein
MLNYKKSLLVKSILNSDYIYVKTKAKKVNIASQRVSTTNKNFYLTLQLFYIIRNLKQLIRIFQFQAKHYNNILQINSSNLFQWDLVKRLNQKFEFKDEFITMGRETCELKLSPKTLLFLNNDILIDNTNIRRFMNSRVYIFILLNTLSKIKNIGGLQLYSKTNQFKAFLFILLVIYQSISLNKNNKFYNKYAFKTKIKDLKTNKTNYKSRKISS